MAFVKSIELDSGVTGEYWRIIQRNSFDKGRDLVEMVLYIDKTHRDEGKAPLNHSVQFIFVEHDYPLLEVDPDRLDIDLLENLPQDYDFHVKYANIRQCAEGAQAKLDADAQLTSNEQKALFFVDAQDVY